MPLDSQELKERSELTDSAMPEVDLVSVPRVCGEVED